MSADPEYICPETSDSQHCGHWQDGGKCCACGQLGDCIGEDSDWPEESP